jgi:hypothetical protein
LSNALQQVSLAYQRAASAARIGDGDAYTAAGQALKAAQADVRRALSRLKQLGYDVS